MKRVAIAAAVALVTVGLATPASGATGENCSFRLVPISQSGSTTTATLELIGCYGTYEEAIEAGYGGTVDVATDVSPSTFTQADIAVVAAASDVLIGTEWDGASYSQSSNSYFASSTCSSSNTWQVNYVGDTWNDRFESGKGFGGCDTNKKFQHADFAGSVQTCTPNCATYGSLSNTISSLRWKP